MIVAGNSHVSMFRGGLLLPDQGNQEVKIHWVGSIRFDQFRSGHPAAVQLSRLFEAEKDWKFICIGNHDIMNLCEVMARDGNATAFNDLITEAMEVFTKLNENGRLGWLICMQQIYEKNGLTASSIMEVANLFNSRLATWCRVQDILVINPVDKYSNGNGIPKSEWLQPDGLHLNGAAAGFYLKEIEKETGLRVSAKRGIGGTVPDLKVNSEVESFCALTAEELGLPVRNASSIPLTTENLSAEILNKINAKLALRGLDSIEVNTDFVSEGLLDSLDLVEVYDFSATLLGPNINFDVELRSLPSAMALADFLLGTEKQPHQSGLNAGFDFCQEDIFNCLNGEDRGEVALAVLADNRIASMSSDIHRRFVELNRTIFGNDNAPYGIYYFLLALVEAHGKRFAQAIALGTNAMRSFHPFHPPRMKTYLTAWTDGRLPNFMEAEIALQARKNSGMPPVWERPIDDNVIRIIPNQSPDLSGQKDGLEAIRKGEKYFSEGRMEDAKLCFWQALEEIGMSDTVLNNLGAVFWQEKNVTDALGHFHLALAWNPKNRDAILNLADALVSLGKRDDARAIVDKFLPSELGNY